MVVSGLSGKLFGRNLVTKWCLNGSLCLFWPLRGQKRHREPLKHHLVTPYLGAFTGVFVAGMDTQCRRNGDGDFEAQLLKVPEFGELVLVLWSNRRSRRERASCCAGNQAGG